MISLCTSLVSCAHRSDELPQAATETAAEATTERTTEAAPTTAESTEATTKKPAETTAKKSAETTAKKPAETTAKKPAETTTKKPAETTTKKPAETTTKKPTEQAASSIADMEAEALRLTNKARKKAGLKAFGTSDELQRCADTRAKELRQKFSHTRPNGQSCFSLNEDLIMGENIAWGQTTPKDVVDGWMNSKHHRENILRERFTLCAVGCYYHKASNTYYWVQLFG